MLHWYRFLFSWWLFIASGGCVLAQENIEHYWQGMPITESYSWRNYNGNAVNSSIAQGDDGLIYVGNADGLLVFDGITWEKYYLPDRRAVKDLSIDKEGRIYVVSEGIFGVIDIGAEDHKFTSFIPKIDPQLRDFKLVRRCHVTKEGVYFVTDKYIFLFGKNELTQSWKTDSRFNKSFFLNGQFYVLQQGQGLFTLVGSQLLLVSDQDLFRKAKRLAISPYDENAWLIATEKGELYTFSSETGLSFDSKIQSQIKFTLQGQSIVSLNEERFALCSMNGLIIIQNGKISQVVDRFSGLADDWVRGLMVDREGVLWAALDNGISKLTLNDGIELFDKKMGLDGQVIKTVLHGKNLYCGTTQGLFKLVSGALKFEKIPGIMPRVWDMLIKNSSLLIATSKGVFLVSENEIKPISSKPTFSLFASQKDPSLVYAAGSTLLPIKYLSPEKWGILSDQEIKLPFLGIEGIEDRHGNIWLSSINEGLLRISPELRQKRYTIDDGLIQNDENGFFFFREKMIVGSGEGFMSYDIKIDSFKLVKELPPVEGDSLTSITGLTTLKDSILVCSTVLPDQCSITELDSMGNYYWNSAYLSQLPLLRAYDIFYKYHHLWLSTDQGLAALKIPNTKNDPVKFNAYVKQVKTIDQDSLVLHYRVPQHFILPYSNNALRFISRASFYNKSEKVEFQYRLEEFNDKWSVWSNELIKDYTNLPEGDFTFRLRARNIFGTVSEGRGVSFTILPPWYRTYWAYLGYISLLISIVYFFAWWRMYRLEKDKTRLKVLVEERTKELVIKSHQLEELGKVKNRFFANISHDLRTPLTLISGPLEESISEDITTSRRSKLLSLSLKNAKWLQRLIDQLLDISKLENDEIPLVLTEGDLVKQINLVLESFEPIAKNKKIKLSRQFNITTLLGYYDHDKLEKILSNILSNAFKFTNEGGQVTVSGGLSEKKDLKMQFLLIKISDTGSGIPFEEQSKIFERFYKTGDQNNMKGAGIGLALVKELIEIYGGDITVKSTPEEGATFTVLLPYARESFGENALLTSASTESDLTPVEELNRPKTKDQPLLLLVEDNADMRIYLREMLGGYFRFEEAENAIVALEKAPSLMPDLIITDLMMPYMTGEEFCQKIKQSDLLGHIPIIMLTAKSSLHSKIEGLEQGADDYLSKPFNNKELLVRVNNLIDQRKRLKLRYYRTMQVKPSDVTVTSADERFLQQAIEVVEKNLLDPNFDVQEFSERLGVSRSYLHRKLKAITDQYTSEFIRTIRLKRAAQLLEKNANIVSQIGYEVGFNDPSYFTKCFKKQFGITPTDYASSERKKEKHHKIVEG